MQSFDEMFAQSGTQLAERIERDTSTLGNLITRHLVEFDRTVKTYGSELVERLGQRTRGGGRVRVDGQVRGQVLAERRLVAVNVDDVRLLREDGLAVGGERVQRSTEGQHAVRNAIWIGPWLGGQVVIGALGRYGDSASNILPNWVDVAVVIVFALAIFYWAVSLTLTKEGIAVAVAKDAQQLAYDTRER